MKNVLASLVFLNLIGFSSAWGQSSYANWIDSFEESMDVDGDSKPDYFRLFKKGKGVFTVFNPSWDTHFVEVELPIKNGFIFKTYRKGQLTHTKKIIKNEKKVKAIIEEWPSPQKKKVVKSFAKGYVRKKVFTWKKKQWRLVSDKKARVPFVTGEIASGAITPAAFFNTGDRFASLPMRQSLPVKGFRIDRSCSGAYDTTMIGYASHAIFETIIPCLESKNPRLARAVVRALKIHRPLITCNAPLPKGLNPKTTSAWTYPLLGENINLHKSVPSTFHEDQPSKASTSYHMYELAGLVFHEVLHQVTGTRHSSDEKGMYNDSIYGCHLLCTPYMVSGYKDQVNFREACHSCVYAMSTKRNPASPPNKGVMCRTIGGDGTVSATNGTRRRLPIGISGITDSARSPLASRITSNYSSDIAWVQEIIEKYGVFAGYLSAQEFMR